MILVQMWTTDQLDSSQYFKFKFPLYRRFFGASILLPPLPGTVSFACVSFALQLKG